MRRSILRYIPLLFVIVFILVNCAKISSPSGGPRDVNPPIVVSDIPKNGSANFKGNSFVVTFNEYIVLDKIADKFMVSPPLNKNPTTTVKGKSLVVQFDEQLKDSTTYTFYFQDAIRDLNEGNAISNYQFVFSTGPVVDSLSVTGNVYNSLSLEVGADLLVFMHKNLVDSAPHKVLPVYITKTDKSGYFRINNVRKGEYKLFALGDKNNNKKYDNNAEVFAFGDSIIKVDATTNFYTEIKEEIKPVTTTLPAVPVVPKTGEFKLYYFTGPQKSQYLTTSQRTQAYSLFYTFALPLDTAKFNFYIPGTTPQSYFIEENSSRDTFKIWITDSTLYSTEIIESILKHPVTDTTGKLVNINDTIPMRYLTPRAVRGTKGADKLSYTLNIKDNTLKPEEKIVIKALSPLREPDTSRIKLYETKDTVLLKLPYLLTRDKLNGAKYTLDAQLKENGRYLLIIDSAAIGNMYGNVSDSLGIRFSVRTKISYGSLTVNLTGYNNDIIVQLLDNNEAVISEIKRKGEGKIFFPYIEKGLYRLRVIYDLDGNGKWTTGDYDLLREPEPVSYYPDELNIKVNWDHIQDWNISVENYKKQTLRKVIAS